MKTPLSLLCVAVACALAVGCGGAKSSSTAGGTNVSVLVGAGSTFVYPLISRWAADYDKRTGITVTYGAIGSGGGIRSISDRTVDFGASDAPLTPDQLRACNGCIQIPWVLGSTAVSYRLKSAPAHLKLDGPTIARIFLGKIRRWNDPAIARLNPGTTLPSTEITPVFRSDSSGTSYNFTDYLSTVSPEFKSKVGTSTQPSFPIGQGAKGSSGVSGVLSHTDGAVTYVDVAYAISSRVSFAAVKNRAGKFVLPNVASTKAAAVAARSPKPNSGISIVDPPPSAAGAYPISTFSYVIVPRRSPKGRALRRFLDYAVTSGQSFGPKLLFAPLPDNVVSTDKRAIAELG